MTPAQNITRHFNGDWHGNQGAFPTPGHSKADRGMTVKDAAGGDVVFHSHNGGDWREVKDECRRLGLLPDRNRANDNCGGQTLRARDVAAWEYTNGDGMVLYRKVRMALPNGGKSYRFEHPDGRGGWLPKRGDADQVPYRLPDILAAEHAAILYMAEGEKQADKLASWGFLATSSKDWRSFDFAGYVKGRTVVILPDNDEEGSRIAESAREAVEKAEGRAIILTLPDLPHKGDVMDWRGSADDLRALTVQALTKPAETFVMADLTAWANTAPTPKAFVMPGFIPRDDVVIVTGDGGTNKSTLALQISACAAAGKPFLGMDVAAGPALYITAEDDNRENHWRLSKIAAAISTTLHALAGKLHVVSLRGRLNNELATFDHDGKLRPTPAYALLRATIEQTGAKLVTLDNVAHLFAGNENDRSQVTAFINLLYQLCGDLGVTILLIAHRNKSGDSYSGSTAWLNAVRSQVLMERVDGDPDVRRMSLGKANYARAGEELSFRWHDFALVRDIDLPDDQRAEIAATAARSADNGAFLSCLAARAEQGDGRHVGPTPGPNYAPSQFEGMREAKGLRRDRLKAAMDRLFAIGAIETHTYRNTSKGRDVTIIRAVGDTPNCPPEPFPNTIPEPPQTVLPNHPPHTPYTTYKGAAPSGPAAPSHEQPKVDLSRVIFAEVDPADEIFRGME